MSATVAFVFPGQGSQFVGMLTDLAKQHPVINLTFAEAGDALDYNLWEVIQQGPAERLNQTDKTQPALLTASFAIWRAWLAAGGERPAYLAGHSLGEYSALVAANALDFAEGVRLVQRRGQLMQAAVPAGQGAMAAVIGLTDEQVEQVCADVANGEAVSAANYNAPGQVVIAGTMAAVQRAMQRCQQVGAKRVLLLPVSVPSHCMLMQSAAALFANDLAEVDWQMPAIPLVQNVSAKVPANLVELKQHLLIQLYSPVRWVESMQWLAQQGVTDAVECGPGAVLSGLNKRCIKSMQTHALGTVDAFNAACTALR